MTRACSLQTSQPVTWMQRPGRIHDLIFEWSKESGGTALIVTHNETLAKLGESQLHLTREGIQKLKGANKAPFW